MRNFYKSIVISLIVLLLFFFHFLILPTFSSASVDLSKDIAALKDEIKGAQAKLDKAKPSQTLEAITLPFSIKNMQKILVSLNQKTEDVKSLAVHINHLNIGLKALEQATHNNDKTGARKVLNDMAAALKALEAETTKGEREKATSKAIVPGRLSSKVEGFLKNLEKMESLEELDRSTGNANFSREELEELKAEIKKPPYSDKIKNLADKAKASLKAKMDAKTQQIITIKQREFKKKRDDELNLLNQQARAKLKTAISNAETRFRAEMASPPPAPPTMALGSRLVLEDPARISYIAPEPFYIDSGLPLRIRGVNLGSTGTVNLTIGTETASPPIENWNQYGLRVRITPEVVNALKGRATGAMREGLIIGRVWVHAEKNIATSEVQFHPRGWGLTLTPEITELSSNEIRPGQEITIEGRYFLPKTSGSIVKFIFGSRNVTGDILEWNDSVIHVRLRSDVSGISAIRGTVQVKNSLGFSADYRINFRPEYELQTLREVVSEYRGSSWEETYTFWDFELINGWTVDNYSADVTEGSIVHRESPRFGSTNPRTVVRVTAQGGRAGLSGETWWVMCFFNLSLQGPRGTNYR
jgi:hypothetical protein